MSENNHVNGNDGIIVLKRQAGRVTRLPGTDQYAINFTVAGTIDSMHTGVVADLDPSFREAGLEVLVSGTLIPAPDIAPMLGGQAMFRLQVSHIEKSDTARP